jgi:hypothetical protein
VDSHPASDQELDAAIEALSDPARLREAQDLVMRVAPRLGGVLGAALDHGGWFGSAHQQAIREATALEEHGERIRAVRSLLGEETRLGMFVGVAVGIELARELGLAAPRANDER